MVGPLKAYAILYVTGKHAGRYATRPALEADETVNDDRPAFWTDKERAEYWVERINGDVIGSVGKVRLSTWTCTEDSE